ncbi:hypothetical protein TcasGA2_TC010250 [Tribolium castaneum]|uniref:DNA-directed DNA polymerase n=1 Tax=Tribolium castaneum TaxID=7070 RepID=D7EJ92_TRICA|nr:hypothetical protein TcasGA2_TC010250 [Tribolium castaneum]
MLKQVAVDTSPRSPEVIHMITPNDWLDNTLDRELIELIDNLEKEYEESRKLGAEAASFENDVTAMKENPQKTDVFYEPESLFKLLTNPSTIVHSICVINPDVMLATWDRVDEDVTPLKTVNVAIAAYTTAGARLELYKYLKPLGGGVLYFDTDSIVFVKRKDEYLPPTGNFLGDLTDEISEYGSGSFISEFVSGGQKLCLQILELQTATI